MSLELPSETEPAELFECAHRGFAVFQDETKVAFVAGQRECTEQRDLFVRGATSSSKCEQGGFECRCSRSERIHLVQHDVQRLTHDRARTAWITGRGPVNTSLQALEGPSVGGCRQIF